MAERDGRVTIPLDYQQRQIAREVGGRWDQLNKVWRFQPTGATLFRLKCAGIQLSRQQPWLATIANDFRRNRLQQLEPVKTWYTEPWPHQIEPTARAAAMDSILLHCAMGSGKTKMALDACRVRRHRWILLLCPKHVGDVWVSEVAKHAPDMRLVNLTSGTVPERAKALRPANYGHPTICAVNYEAAWREPMAKTILAQEWDCLILDESHRIKSASAKQSRFAMRIRAGHKLALTGTPMPHSPLDLYGQYRTLDIGVFGPRNAEFKARYAELGPFHEVRRFVRQEELCERMDWLRVEVRQDALTLPPIQYLERTCVLCAQARIFYNDLERDLIAEVNGNVVTVVNALVKLLRLQQIAAGYLPIDDEGAVELIDDSKRQLLRELLEDLPHERVVVFCRFRADLKVLHEICEDLNRPSYEISGSRRDYLAWKEMGDDLDATEFGPCNDSAVMGVQLQAGLGIDLTEARYAVFYTLGFSLGDYQQCVARLHRPGQERPTIIYHLLTKDTVDGKILKALAKKQDVIEYVLTGMRKGECNV